MVTIEFIVSYLFIVKNTKMSDDEYVVECLQELWELDDQHFLVDFH